MACHNDLEQIVRSVDSLRRAMKTEIIAHKRDAGTMMRESVMMTKELNNLRQTARAMQLQQKAIEQTGELTAQTDLSELMGLLGVHVKKPSTPGISGPVAAADPALPPFPPSAGSDRLRSRGGTVARTAALKTTLADGKLLHSAGGHRSSNAGGNGPLTGTVSKQDQWEAWREIQMQYDQMKVLEDQLMAVCYSLNIDPIPVIVGIDTTLL